MDLTAGIQAESVELETSPNCWDEGGDGRKKILTTTAAARMKSFCTAQRPQIVHADNLRTPAFFSSDNLASFECVIANPPFCLENVGR